MKVHVLAIHGIGVDNKKAFHKRCQRLQAELQEQLRRQARAGVRPDLAAHQIEVVVNGVWWASAATQRVREVLSGRQTAITTFAIRTVADATMYAFSQKDTGGLYEEIHELLRDGIREHLVTTDPNTKNVIVAHSLGGLIVSDWLWNAQMSQEHEQDKQLLLEKRLDVLATTGCNIPLFLAGKQHIQAIDTRLAPLEGLLWCNVYYHRDPLGFALEPMSERFDPQAQGRPYNEVVDDHRIGGRTVAIHTKYWRQRTVNQHIARAILKN